MKALILLSLLFLPFSVAAEIAGNWISNPTGRFVEFRDDGTFLGDGFGSTIQTQTGQYELLGDRSGIILYDEDAPVVMDVRELNEERMVLSFCGGAIVLERATPGEVDERRAIFSAMERKEQYIRNLMTIVRAGQRYISQEGVTAVAYSDLVGVYFDVIEPIDGESYDDLIVHADGGRISVQNNDEEVFEYVY